MDNRQHLTLAAELGYGDPPPPLGAAGGDGGGGGTDEGWLTGSAEAAVAEPVRLVIDLGDCSDLPAADSAGSKA